MNEFEKLASKILRKLDSTCKHSFEPDFTPFNSYCAISRLLDEAKKEFPPFVFENPYIVPEYALTEIKKWFVKWFGEA